MRVYFIDGRRPKCVAAFTEFVVRHLPGDQCRSSQEAVTPQGAPRPRAGAATNRSRQLGAPAFAHDAIGLLSSVHWQTAMKPALHVTLAVVATAVLAGYLISHLLLPESDTGGRQLPHERSRQPANGTICRYIIRMFSSAAEAVAGCGP